MYIKNKIEYLDIFMPIYNLLEYSDNYSMTSGSLWNYYIDEENDVANKNNDAGNYRINNNKTIISKSFEHKTITEAHQLIIIYYKQKLLSK